ncbi:MAG TPA: GNAT family N-acetyltransferase [Fimbriimonas sp.]|nr:GNAT family N-acetyltransferase [Fimbriimonas sp.]
MAIHIRKATLEDIPALEELIEASARGLAGKHYTEEQVEAALGTAWGVDTELIRDGTYFAADFDGKIVGCGGWSFRRTLFGSDNQANRQSESLDRTSEPARIRAFFVHPEYSGMGIATQILERCEQEARKHGFKSTALVSTLSGHSFYLRHHYCGTDHKTYSLPHKLTIEFIPMTKYLA